MNNSKNSLSILIVDDRKENIDLLEAALCDTNYEIHSAHSGTEGLKLANEIKPDIMLLDIMMDDIDGFEVCKTIKKDPKIAQILIVMITASNEESYKKKALSYGANDFLNKPVNIEILLARLRSLAKISIKIKNSSHSIQSDTAKEVLLKFPKNQELLIINKNQSEGKNLESTLKNDFSKITICNTHEEGLATISKQQYNAIILSLCDDQSFAIRLISEARSSTLNQNTPIVFLITENQANKIPEFLDLGASDCMVYSPQDNIELISRCKTCIQYSDYAAAIDKEKNELSSSAIYDGLTNLLTRKQFDQEIKKVIELNSKKTKAPFLALIDIDNFKSINDQYGHPAGDKVLKIVSNIIKKISGPSNLVARYGGEEMAIIFPNETIDNVNNIAEKIRKTVEDNELSNENITIKATISIGIAELKQEESPEILVKKADKALYEAKNTGKNRVIFI